MIDGVMPSVCFCHFGKALLSLEGFNIRRGGDRYHAASFLLLGKLAGTGAPDRMRVYRGRDEQDKAW
jgi:hypothetical protein